MKRREAVGANLALARLDYAELQQQLTDIVSGVQLLTGAVARITDGLRAAQNGGTVGDQWARTWGETVTKTRAAEMLGVSRNNLTKIIGEGGIKLTPDGRVVVRSAAEWANSVPAQRRAAAHRV